MLSKKNLLAFAAGIALSLIIFFLVKGWEQSARFSEFKYKSADHAAAIQTEFEHVEKVVADIRLLIAHAILDDHHNPLDPNAFMPMAEKLVLDDPTLLSIGWAIEEKNIPASNQPEPLKVMYVSHGKNADSDDLTKDSYYNDHADLTWMHQNKQTVSAYVHQDGASNDALSNEILDHELNFIAPITDHQQAGTSRHHVGVLIVEFSIDALIERAVAKLPVAAQDIRLFTVDKQSHRHLVHTHMSRSRNPDTQLIRTGLMDQIFFNFSGLRWQLEFEAAPRFFHKHPIVLAWQSLAICLLLTFFFSWYVRSALRQTIIIEAKVQQRTEELAKLATVVEQTNEIVVITNKQGIIEYVNPSFTRVSGYSADEAIGQTPAIVKSCKHSESFYADMWSALNSGKVWHDDFINRDKQGDFYTVDQTITPILDDDGSIMAFASVQRDVTRAREMELQLQHSDRVESLGILAGGIAHDFNNLLAAILGNTTLAQRKLDVTSPALHNLEAVESASNSAAELCRQMLAYSGKGQFIVKAINISALVEDMGKLIDVSLAKNVVLKYQLNEQLPAIEADVAQMQQIVLNLITNASEAIDGKSGVISIATGVMQVDENYLQGCVTGNHVQAGRYVYLEVSDTGCGMDAVTQKKIFDPFFTTKFTGRGLGMSAMLGIVKGHKGAMRIYSEPGQGTTMKIAFPVSRNSFENANQTDKDQSDPIFSGTVLVVDDDESVREMANAMLESFGFDVLTAMHGCDGVDVFKQHGNSIALVLLDMTMPKMDGATCFHALKEIDPDVRVILSSGYSEEDATARFMGKGLAGFIQKPYSPEALAKILEEVLITKNA